MKFINEHLKKEKDGINITLFNKDQRYLEFYLTSNKNKKFELELYNYYGPKKLKFESIKPNLFKNIEIFIQLNNKSFSNLSYFIKNLNELYNY